jgi:hypothetical protein
MSLGAAAASTHSMTNGHFETPTGGANASWGNVGGGTGTGGVRIGGGAAAAAAGGLANNLLYQQIMAGRQNSGTAAATAAGGTTTGIGGMSSMYPQRPNTTTTTTGNVASIYNNLLPQSSNHSHKRELDSMSGGGTGGSGLSSSQHSHQPQQPHPSQRPKLEPTPISTSSSSNRNGVPRTIAQHTQLLQRGNTEGGRLYSHYMLSIDELFQLPPTPTHEEYCARLNIPGMTPDMIPGTHLAALTASSFAEIALGALVCNEVSLAMELCNAVVHCLRESVQEPVQIPITFEVAKAYFLLGIFRALRGDMTRYFKYRRVCMTYLTKIEVRSQVHVCV